MDQNQATSGAVAGEAGWHNEAARHVTNVLDRVIGGVDRAGASTTEPHHNGYDSSRCEAPGCGRPWWNDEGHHHLVAEVMRELGLL